MNYHWIGVDLGGTKILAGLFDDNFRVLARAKEATDPELGAPGVFSRIRSAVETLLSETGVKPALVRGLGLGVPGQVDPRVGKVRYAPNLDWHDLELASVIPTDWPWAVHVENDVRLGTYGEYMHG